MKSFSALERSKHMERMENDFFDLVIIGGGINGAGVARDACLRGMKVALVEAHDFASGTSSRSSKLIHGGIRYLENLEFHLVFEALSERQKLLHIAPHLVRPLKFLIPIYEGGRVSAFKMGLGMWLYDALSLFDAPESHDRLTPREALGEIEFLRAEGLEAAFTYYDADMDDDRLVLETLRSANEVGLCAANYVEAIGCELDASGKMQTLRVRDQKGGKEFSVRGRHFVSTVGPWSDQLGSSLFKDWKKKLRPTKGIHLTFSKFRFPLSMAVVMAAEERIVFAIPRRDMVIVGTTDTDFKGDPREAVAERSEVEYLIEVVNKYFPGLQIKLSDVQSTYAGVRPLVDDGARSEGKTSREHTIVTDEHGVTYVMGGKYTTYRKVAEEAINEALRSFPLEDRVQWARGSTDQPLNSWVSRELMADAENMSRRIATMADLPEAGGRLLFDRYGAEAVEMVQRLGPYPSVLQYEAAQAITMTMCLSLRDFYFRRVPLFLNSSDHGLSHLKLVSEVFQSYLGWNEKELADQVEELEQQIRRELAWRAN